jgi:glutathione S-transferase
MADHPEYTPDELATAQRVYLETASWTKAARSIGRSVNGTRQALLRRGTEADRGKLYTRALDAAVQSAVDAGAEAVRRLRRDLRDPKTRTNAAFALSDAARTINQMRVAHAKLVGDHAPEGHNVNLAASVVILPELDDVAEAAGGVAPEPGASDPVPGLPRA